MCCYTCSIFVTPFQVSGEDLSLYPRAWLVTLSVEACCIVDALLGRYGALLGRFGGSVLPPFYVPKINMLLHILVFLHI